MIRYLLTLALALIASPARAQTITVATKLPDGNGDGRIVVEKKAVTLGVPKKTILFDCGSKAAPFVYAIGSLDKCPAQIATVSGVTPKAKAATLNATNGVIPLNSCRPVRVLGAYRIVETYSTGTYRDMICSGIVGEGIKREGIRLKGTIQNVTIENFRLIHDATPNVSPHLPEGIHVENGSNVTIRDGVVSGYRMTMPAGRYINGDGIATELKTTGTITSVTSSDNSDGGFDLKGQWMVDQLAAERNGRGFRFWQQITAGTLIARDNRTAVWASKEAVVTIDKLVVIGSGAIVEVEPGGKVTIKACDLSRWTGTEKVKGKGAVTFGPTCKLP